MDTTTPVTLVVGVGARRAATAEAVLRLLDAVLRRASVTAAALAALASTDARTEHPALRGAAERLGLPLLGFGPDALARVAVPSPSAAVRAAVATPSVAEAAALLACGAPAPGARLVVPKTRGDGVTAALARGSVLRASPPR